jgi:hypothetical protein
MAYQIVSPRETGGNIFKPKQNQPTIQSRIRPFVSSLGLDFGFGIKEPLKVAARKAKPSHPLRYLSKVMWCGVVWCGVVWCGVVWCGVVWCGVVWCGVVWLH